MPSGFGMLFPLMVMLIIWGSIIAGAIIIVISVRKTSKSAASIDSNVKEMLDILKSKDLSKE